MNVGDCLDEADQLLTGRRDVACWPIAAAVLLRAALEAAIDDHLTTVLPGIGRVPMRARLLVLSTASGTDRPAALEAALTWSLLSRAVHHHAYELSPTLAELRTWQTSVARFVAS